MASITKSAMYGSTNILKSHLEVDPHIIDEIDRRLRVNNGTEVPHAVEDMLLLLEENDQIYSGELSRLQSRIHLLSTQQQRLRESYRSTSSVPLLPKLNHLSLKYAGKTFDDAGFADVVKSRCLGNTEAQMMGIDPLRSLVLKFLDRTAASSEEDTEIYKPIAVLEKAGFRILVKAHSCLEVRVASISSTHVKHTIVDHYLGANVRQDL
ncbi:hypothetical protein GG344DRAFT_82154 [Lentinula edodes]|nr:hypothetical protein GG344DRAFT_82154 [Lentinula edodes]